MELGTIIIGLVIVGFGALPFVLTSQSKRKTEKRLLTYLQTLASGHNAVVSEIETSLQFAIGLSKDGGEVFFAKTKKGTETGQCILLNNVKKCKINNVTRTIGSGKNKESVIDRLELVFMLKDAKAPEQTLVFFDTNDELQLTDELEIARKWEDRLNAVLTGSK